MGVNASVPQSPPESRARKVISNDCSAIAAPVSARKSRKSKVALVSPLRIESIPYVFVPAQPLPAVEAEAPGWMWYVPLPAARVMTRSTATPPAALAASPSAYGR